MDIRILVTGAGTGASGNLIRGLRATTLMPYIVGVNDDRFTLRQSPADRNYLVPRPAAAAFTDVTAEIVQRERINVVMATGDEHVKALSDRRDEFPIPLFLPRRETIDLCQDKYTLNACLRERDIPAPLTYPVTDLEDVDDIMARLPRQRFAWCRLRRGSRSMGATAVTSAEQARAWIGQWNDLQGVAASNFTLSEYLPGRHLVLQGVWREGALLLAQTVECVSYFAAGNNPTGVFSLPSLAKTVFEPAVLDVCLRALQAIDARASGAFVIELREDVRGVPAITEINVGRFAMGVTALLGTARHNLLEVFINSAIGEPVAVDTPYESSAQYYLVRDVDMTPGVFSLGELVGEGALDPFPAASSS
jgi:carbamoyl-phosphate synthase large subunit